MKLVLTEVEMLGGLRAERVAEEPLAAGVAEVESHAHGALVEQPVTIMFVEPFEQFLHLFEMVGFVTPIAAATSLAPFSPILNRRENLDLDHVSHVRLRVDWAFANVARIVKHRLLHEAVAEGRADEFSVSALEHPRPMTLSLPASCDKGKSRARPFSKRTPALEAEGIWQASTPAATLEKSVKFGWLFRRTNEVMGCLARRLRRRRCLGVLVAR